MEKKHKIVFVLVGVLFLSVILFLSFRPRTPGAFDEFAKCLNSEGVVMYGTEWCDFCQRQKDMFDGSFDLVNYIDCDRNTPECNARGVEGFPSWDIEGELYSGIMDLGELSELTGCPLY